MTIELKSYLASIIESFSSSDPFIDSQAENVDELYLSEVRDSGWKDLDEDPLEDDEDGADEIGEEEGAKELTISEVLDKERDVVILGNPGIGKTTLLRHAALNLATEYVRYGAGIIPVYIALKDIYEGKTLEDKLNDFLSDKVIANAYLKGEVYFLFDGLNEMRKDIYGPSIQLIGRLINEKNGAGVVVTTRKYGYKNQLGIPQYEIKDFTNDDIRQYLSKSTGSDDVFNKVVRFRKMLPLLKNPLLLNMLTRIWKQEHKLLGSKAELYESFVSFQIRKSVAGGAYDGKEEKLGNLLSRIAFGMRSYGFLSDDIEGFSKIVEDYVPEEEVEIATDALLKSGLLCIDTVSTEFHYVTFIHETFQEYLSSKEVAKHFIDKGEYNIDVIADEWMETTNLVLQIINLKNDEKLLLNALNEMYVQAKGKSKDSVILYALPRLVTICKDLALNSEVCDSWIQQLILFYMDRYIHLPVEEHTDIRFNTLVHSVFHLRHTELHRLFWKDIRWMKEWLNFEEEQHSEPQQDPTKERARILGAALYKCVFNVDIALNLLVQKKELEYMPLVIRRIDKILHIVYANFKPDDYKTLYLKGYTQFLFNTLDAQFISKELESGVNIDLTRAKTLLRPQYPECISYYYREIIPMKQQDLDGSSSYQTFFKFAHLKEAQKEIFSGAYYVQYMQKILRYMQRLPEEYLSEYYWEYVRREGEKYKKEEKKQQGQVTFTLLVKSSTGPYIYLPQKTVVGEIPDNNFNKQFNDFVKEYPGALLNRLYVYSIKYDSMGMDASTGIDISEFLEGSLGCAFLGDTILSFSTRKIKEIEDMSGYNYYFDGQLAHRITVVVRERMKLLVSPCPVDSTFTYCPDTIVDSSKLCYYSLEEIYTNYFVELSKGKFNQIVEANMVGYFPEKMILEGSMPTKLYYVDKVDKETVYMFDIFDQTSMSRNDAYKLMLRPQDLVICYDKTYYLVKKITNPQVLGFKEGVFRSGRNYKKIIVDDEGNRYSYYDEKLEYTYSDKVWFIPDRRTEDKFYARYIIPRIK